MTSGFSLQPRSDVAHLRAAFARHGRIELRDFIPPEQTAALRDHLLARKDWRTVLNAGENVYEIARSGLGAMTAEQREELDRRVAESARAGFQYRYEAVRVADETAGRTEAASVLTRFVDFMGSPAVLTQLGEVTGLADLAFADGQATAYGAGDFLTLHDDDVAGKHRRAAYVLGLAPDWRADWGGLLMFHRGDGNIDEAFVPAMGALRLFAVPTPHSVSYVTPFAPEPRLSVTGWLRARRPDS